MGESRGDEGLKRRLEYFKQAIEIDPTYALAYVALCRTYFELENNSILTPQEAYPKAREAANRALELDENLADAHVALAGLKMNYEYNWHGAEESAKRALEINPNSARAHYMYGACLNIVGRQQEALAELEKVKALDPMQAPWSHINAHWGTRQYHRVIEDALAWLEANPAEPMAHFCLGCAYTQERMYDRAIAEFKTVLKLEELDFPGSRAGLAYAQGMSGRKSEARKILYELLELSRKRYVRPYYVGVVYAGLGDSDRAFEWFEKAYEERSSHLVVFKVDPFLDPIRADPRFQALLRRMNFPP